MGLDQYLLAKMKTKKNKTEDLTGACGGLFGFAPKNANGMQEIGYWRKFYKLDDLIAELFLDKDPDGDYWSMNCKDIPLDEDDLIHIRCYAEEEIDMINEQYEGEEVPEYSEDYYQKINWEKTRDVFAKAFELVKTKGAKIYYKYWA